MLKKGGGIWVDGDRFFDREVEVEALMERIADGRHTLLTAQRRMGKTSLVRETLRRLAEKGEFEPLFVDLEDANGAEDAIAEIAAHTLAAQGHWLPIKRAFANFLEQAGDRVEELNVMELKVKLRAGIDRGNWKERGDAVFRALAQHENPSCWRSTKCRSWSIAYSRERLPHHTRRICQKLRVLHTAAGWRWSSDAPDAGSPSSF